MDSHKLYINNVPFNGLGIRKIILFILLIGALDSCKKLVEIPPPTDAISDNAVFKSDATAISVLTDIYTSMNTTPFQGSLSSGSISLFGGLAADEFTLESSITEPYVNYYQNTLSQTTTSATGAEHWTLLYNFIFKCNAAIEGLSSSNADVINAKVRDQLLGEAKFLRAFYYFYLVNEYGGVPLALSTDPKITSHLARATEADVYQQIISDLLIANDKLSSDYLDATLLRMSPERVRPTNWASKALLARVYLYLGNWQKAEEQSSLLINNSAKFSLLPINDVFLKNSRETIWQIQPTEIDFNTLEGKTLIIPSTGPGYDNPVYLSDQLLSSFEAGDQRAQNGNWIDSINVSGVPYRFANKYKINSSPGVTSASDMSEYFMVLRLAEQYLIRAEARAQQNNLSGAQDDLNAIRTRASLGSLTFTDKPTALAAILHERQVELFSEWGHRWFDLKRTGTIDAVMNIVTPQKANGAPWRSYQKLFPIPIGDIQKNSNLMQNPGY